MRSVRVQQFLKLALAAALPAATGISWASLRGSGHDFSTKSWSSSGESCGVCHPSRTARANQPAAIWNHETTTAFFGTYRSETMDAVVGQPSEVSRLCLSCHDGTVAVNAFGGNPGTEFVAGRALLGTDLSNDHPISLTYDAALAARDGGLFDPSTKTVPALGGQTIQQALLVNNRLECISCHDVHRLKGESATDRHALIVRNNHDGLCFTCHNK